MIQPVSMKSVTVVSRAGFSFLVLLYNLVVYRVVKNPLALDGVNLDARWLDGDSGNEPVRNFLGRY